MDRLLAIIDYLRGRERTTTGHLAAHLGVSERTVRRDLIRLQALDIQVETEPGRLGGLRLTRGALLPALRFTDDEALVLALGLRQAGLEGEGRFAGAAGSALRRLEHVLTGELGGRIEAAIAALTTDEARPWNLGDISSDTVLTLSDAVQRRGRLRVRYRTAPGHGTERDLDPYGVVQLVGHWYVTGYCHLRRAIRTFRIDRLTVLDAPGMTFEVPAGFDALETVSQAVARSPSPASVTCRLWVQTTVDAVRAWLPRYRASLELHGGGVLIHIHAEPRNFRMIALGLLDFTCAVQVLEPPELHANFAELAGRAAALGRGERVG